MISNKGMKYYLIVFFVSMAFVLVYGTIVSVSSGGIDFVYLMSLATVPFAFTGFLILFDFLLAKILPKKPAVKAMNEYEQYVLNATEILKETEEFSIEDFRKMRNSDRFQKTLKRLHQIQTFGETEENNYRMIEKKFKKDSVEYKAIQKLINK